MNCLRSHSLDDDDTFSNISRISYGLQNSLNSIYNSDSECSGPVSVRDMIHHYNNQVKRNETYNDINHKNTYKVNAAKRYHHSSQHLLASTKSSYCGLNSFCSNTNCCNRLQDDNYNNSAIICCKNCTACSNCRNRSRNNSTSNKILSSTASSASFLKLQPNENDQKPNNNFSMQNSRSSSCTRSLSAYGNKINAKDTTHILAVENCSNIKDETSIEAAVAGADISVDTTTSTCNNPTQLNDFCTELSLDCSNGLFKNNINSQVVAEEKKNRLLLSDSAEEANCCQQHQQPPPETTYQSKTTIAKTSSGVRIIVDIFFDQERCANASDIVGSRVETDIPQSRILDEFQQQTQTARTEADSHSHKGL